LFSDDHDGNVSEIAAAARSDGIEFFAVGVGQYQLTELLVRF